MKINLKHGIDQLVFGMKGKEVIGFLGKPDREYSDEDDNTIFLYNALKLRLTFYKDEDFRFGYFVSSSPSLELFDKKLIGRKVNEVVNELKQKGLSGWDREEFDTFENFFNEKNWAILQTEFGEIVKFELGAVINDKDEFDWKFKSK